jgi:hypothetical protein
LIFIFEIAANATADVSEPIAAIRPFIMSYSLPVFVHSKTLNMPSTQCPIHGKHYLNLGHYEKHLQKVHGERVRTTTWLKSYPNAHEGDYIILDHIDQPTFILK